MTSSLQRLLLGLTSLAIVVVTLGNLTLSIQRQTDEAALQLAARTQRLASAAAPLLLNALVVGDLASAEQILRNLNDDGTWSAVKLYEADGHTLMLDASPATSGVAKAPRWFRRLMAVDLHEFRLPIAAAPVVYGVLAVTSSSERLVNELWGQTRATAIVDLVLLATLLALMKAILTYGLRPVRALGASAARFGSGDLTARMQETRLAEVAPTVRAFNTMADNLERLLAELGAKEAANRRLAASVEQSGDAIVTVDLDQCVTSWNVGARRLFGRTTDEMLGRPIGTAFSESPEEVAKQVGRLMQVRPPQRMETTLRSRSGQIIWVAASSSPLHAEDGAATGHIVIARDVTDRKNTETELRRARDQAEAGNRAKAEFVAVMSHEIRTPMNGIMGMTELLMGTDLDASQREALAIVKTSAEALLQILDDILDFSKIEAGRIELEAVPFSLQTTIGGAVKPLTLRAHEKGLELGIVIAPGVPDALLGDPGRLRQVLVNLVGNAVKFTERGDVVVGIKATQPSEGLVELQCTVSDTGIGIAVAKRHVIFDVFTQADSTMTRRYGGTGLGLAITKRLVELMGGQIWVESEEGHGSTFSFTARFALGRASEARATPRYPARLRGLPVLVVDDSATARRILSEMLAHAGLRPTAADGGEAAWAMLEQARASGALPALVVTDYHMPDLDGFELARRIKGEPTLAGLPIVMVSSSGLPDDARRARSIGISAYLTKPVTQGELLAEIRRIRGAHEVPASTLPSPSEVPRQTDRRLRILLAEDNVINQMVAFHMLERLGHHMVVVESGRAALAALEAQAFDLVLLDVEMPDIDGLEATMAIRTAEAAVQAGTRQPAAASSYAAHRTGRIPIVALTAHALSGSEERCLAAGMDGFLSKPFKSDDLVGVIARFTTAVVPD